MKYLSNQPIVFGHTPKPEPRKQVEEFGGPAMEIPEQDKCPSGRHNKKLTECYCGL